MYTMKLYMFDKNERFLEDMMKKENLIKTIEFEQPNSEIEFEVLMESIDYEGCLYSLYKDGKSFCSGVLTSDSLYDDIM